MNVLKAEVQRQALLPLPSCERRWTCVQRPGPPSFLFSYQRPLALISSRSHKNTEKERPLTGRGFFFLPPPSTAKLTEVCTPHTSQRKAIIHQPGYLQTSTQETKLWTSKYPPPMKKMHTYQPMFFLKLQPFCQTWLYFPSTMAKSCDTERKLSVKRSCHVPVCVISPIVSLALTVYLAWHFHNNHFGLSHSALWLADVCQGTVFLSIHTAIIKINRSYLSSVCVCAGCPNSWSMKPSLYCITQWTNQLYSLSTTLFSPLVETHAALEWTDGWIVMTFVCIHQTAYGLGCQQKT